MNPTSGSRWSASSRGIRSSAGHAVLRAILVGVVVVCAGARAGASPALASAAAQRVAVPSYFYPGTYWSQLEAGVGQGVGLAIINPASGPADAVIQDYVDQIAHSQAAGLTVLGYVDTAYGTRSPTAVKDDIRDYYRWYGVDGIFFDQTPNEVGACTQQAYYRDLYDHVKSLSGKRVVVINPGARTHECYITTADIMVNFESEYAAYRDWQLPGTAWEWAYPADRFWHLVHTTAVADMPNAIALTKQRNAGWVYVTPDFIEDDPETPQVEENPCDDPATTDKIEKCDPWDTLPPGSYWVDLLERAANAGPDEACRVPVLPSMGPDAAFLPGRITSDSVNFRVGPGLGCDVIRTFAAGESVMILKGTAEADDRVWQRVSDADGVTGWVVAEFVEFDEPEVKVAG
jgi:hypothetical protein